MIVLKMLLYLAVLAGVLVLAYYTTKLIAGSAGNRQSSSSIKVLEKVMLGKDSYLLIVRIQDRVSLIGVTPGGISKLEELEEYQETSPEAVQDFGKILAGQIHRNIDRNKGRGDRR